MSKTTGCRETSRSFPAGFHAGGKTSPRGQFTMLQDKGDAMCALSANRRSCTLREYLCRAQAGVRRAWLLGRGEGIETARLMDGIHRRSKPAAKLTSQAVVRSGSSPAGATKCLIAVTGRTAPGSARSTSRMKRIMTHTGFHGGKHGQPHRLWTQLLFGRVFRDCSLVQLALLLVARLIETGKLVAMAWKAAEVELVRRHKQPQPARRLQRPRPSRRPGLGIAGRR
jgi:hypothetical protein